MRRSYRGAFTDEKVPREDHITDEDRICNKIADVLNVPDEYDVVCLLPVGKASDKPIMPGKKSFDERVKFNGWT